MNPYIKLFRKNLINIPGWRTKRKIVVIESDDWGSVRIPSKEVFDRFVSKGIRIDKDLRMNYFVKNDCLESEEDITELFNLLETFTDRNSNHPVITANAVVANPDFKRISACGFKDYFFEPITETYKRYPDHDNVLKLWRDYGMPKKLLWPQFHGREHVNVKYYMQILNSSNYSEKLAFDNEAILGIDVPGEPLQPYNFLAAFEYDSEEHKKEIEQITTNGLRLFKNIFGITSKSFVASCGIQGKHLDKILFDSGVIYHQSGSQLRPLGSGRYHTDQYLWGHLNDVGQTHWRRNCTFEPSRDPDYNWAKHCFEEIKIAFRWGKPAVINSHRVNYVGGIFKENRDNSLKQLKELLVKIMNTWPDVEFFPSDELGEIIIESKNNL